MIIRGTYHAHSTYSGDGTFSLRELKEQFMKQGFQFAIMTEHAEDLTPESYRAYHAECRLLSDDSFLFIPGLEVPYEGKVHVGCFPLQSSYGVVPLYRDGITMLKREGAVTIYHHPSKQKYYVNDTFAALLDGVEIWNSRYEGRVAPSRKTLRFAQEHFKGKIWFGGLDLHRASQFGGPTIALQVDALREEDIVTAVRTMKYALEGRRYTYIPGTFLTPYYTILRGLYDAAIWFRKKM